MLTVDLGKASHSQRRRANYRHHIDERGRRRREEKRRQNVHCRRNPDGKELQKVWVGMKRHRRVGD